MKKVIPLIFIFMLTSCTVKSPCKTPNELLLSIKNYSCKMQISSFSNKNSTEYLALQSYSSLGKYSMEFLDNENLKISYENSVLNITSNLFDKTLEEKDYPELNKNPLFLSYFINTYFNLENSNNVKTTANSIYMTLPDSNDIIYSAELTFNNDLPHTLTYFDKNGNIKVNIIYNEFTFI